MAVPGYCFGAQPGVEEVWIQINFHTLKNNWLPLLLPGGGCGAQAGERAHEQPEADERRLHGCVVRHRLHLSQPQFSAHPRKYPQITLFPDLTLTPHSLSTRGPSKLNAI
jgi:hypothetical protein